MKEYNRLLKKIPLFSGIGEEELEKLLSCLGASPRRYGPGTAILQAGEPARCMGILLEGRIQVIREEFSGERTILTELVPGDLFAEAFACAPAGPEGENLLPVTVLAMEKSAVLMLDCRRILTSCSSACDFHTRLISNMLGVLAKKNLLLNRRIGHLSQRSTREKVLSYLREQAALAGDREFAIPFNRQELADYLCVERSALSAVLGRLRREGILEFHKNRFRLIEKTSKKRLN